MLRETVSLFKLNLYSYFYWMTKHQDDPRTGVHGITYVLNLLINIGKKKTISRLRFPNFIEMK